MDDFHQEEVTDELDEVYGKGAVFRLRGTFKKDGTFVTDRIIWLDDFNGIAGNIDILDKVIEKLEEMAQEPIVTHNEYILQHSTHQRKFARELLMFIEHLKESQYNNIESGHNRSDV